MLFLSFTRYTRPHPHASALITIDLQNDFVLPGAPAEGEGAMGAARHASELAVLYRKLKQPIVHVVRIYTKEHDAASVDACRREAVQRGLSLVISGSEGMQPVAGLLPEGIYADGELLRSGKVQQISDNEFVLYKPRWSAFDRTPLKELLVDLAVDTVAICGTWFANCVRTSLYEATAQEFRAVALEDGIAGMNEVGKDDLIKIQCGVCSCAEWKAELESALRK